MSRQQHVCGYQHGPGSDAPEDSECIICRTALCEDGSEATQARSDLPCGHSQWHEDCILTWLTQHNTCPICRAEVSDAHELSEELANRRQAALEDYVEEQRVNLQSQVNNIEGELVAFRSQLEQLYSEHAELCDAIERLQLHQEESRLNAERMRLHLEHAELCESIQRLRQQHGAGNVQASTRQDPQEEGGGAMQLAFPTASDGDVGTAGHIAFAKALLERLRGAVLRLPCTATQVFQTLAAPGSGKLGPCEVARILSGLEARVSNAVVSEAFTQLDADRSGFVEEEDWLTALRLPRVETGMARGGQLRRHSPIAERARRLDASL